MHNRYRRIYSKLDSLTRDLPTKRQQTFRQYAAVDIEAIRAVSGNPDLAENEVFDFPRFVIARSGRNHNKTEVTAEAQQAAVELWVGKPVYYQDHRTEASNQIARIYKSWIETQDGQTITYGRAYAVKTVSNADLLTSIRNGIHREMPCGYDVTKSVCSICGADTLRSHCEDHMSDPEYYARDLEFIPDHISFVGRPAITGAGIQHARCSEAEKKVLSDIDDEYEKHFAQQVEMERLAEDGKTFREWTSAEFHKWYGLNNANASEAEIKELTDKLSAREMITFARIEQGRYPDIIPSGKQQTQAPDDNETETVTSPAYKTINDLYTKGKQ